jgi:hypothetical protein
VPAPSAGHRQTADFAGAATDFAGAAAGLASAAFAAFLGLALTGALMGMSRAVILLPSRLGGRSTLPTSASFSST